MCSKDKKHHDGHWRKKKKYAKMSLGRIFLGALLVMVLWNAVVPDLFGLPNLGYWQAFAILFLSRILFGWSGDAHHEEWEKRGGRWREELAAKMKEHCDQKKSGPKNKEDDEKFKKGFTSGKWDVNVIDVEEEEEKKEDKGSDQDDSEDEK